MVKAVEIINKDNFILRGFLHLPPHATKIVVMLHGFTGNKTEHNGHFRNLSRMLEKEGIASLRMDFHGNGESDGEFSDFVFENALDDANRMIKYAKEVEGIKECYLLGFSMGGAMASLVANDSIDKLVLWSAAGTMKETAHRSLDGWRKLDNDHSYSNGFIISRAYVDSIDKYDMYQNCGNFHNPCLIVQGSEDLSVNPKCAMKYHELIKNSKLHLIEGAGHGYNAYEEALELYNVTIDFLK